MYFLIALLVNGDAVYNALFIESSFCWPRLACGRLCWLATVIF